MTENAFGTIEKKQNIDPVLRMKLLDGAFAVSPDLVFVKDVRGVYNYVSHSFVEAAGASSVDDIIGYTDADVFPPILARRYMIIDRDILSSGEDKVGYKERLPDFNGKERYCVTSKFVLRDENGEIIGIFGFCRDHTKQFLEQSYHQQEIRYLFDLPKDCYYAVYIDVDEWRVIDDRRQVVDGIMLGYAFDMPDFSPYVAEGREAKDFYATLSKESIHEIYAEGRRDAHYEYARVMPDGSQKWVRTDIKLLVDPSNAHLCAMFLVSDINAKREREEKLIYAAERDEMTGLLNRATTLQRIKSYLAKKKEGTCSMYIIDIDNFKSLNDSYGHMCGDRFIEDFAHMLKSCFRDNDIVGRLGGDEFIVLLDGVGDAKMLKRRAEVVLSKVSRLCERYPELTLSASIGGCIYEEGMNFEALYARADDALYEAKNTGKSSFVLK